MRKPPQIGDAPIESEFKSKMNTLARGLDTILNGDAKPKKAGFVLMVFKFGDEGRCNYISNADRVDVITMFKEQLNRFEGMPETKSKGKH